ncbi:MAG: DivIVA domain-containing protein [Clostridia bacterium]|nr:DivIVA domain-containing protein [Clostridia bacterium]
MFGRKKREIQELCRTNDMLNAKIRELEAEVTRLRGQESAVLKAIMQANSTAERIEKEAGDESERLIASAQEKIRDAATRANEILAYADEESASIRKSADEYSDNLRLDANVFAERTIFASQQEVKKRKDVSEKLNEMLRGTSEYLDRQAAAFKEMLSTVIRENDERTRELCREVEKCACSCEECAEPCAMHGEAAPEEEKLPEQYDTPAELMKSIYLIQKRDIPLSAEQAGADKHGEEPRKEDSEEASAS